MATYYILVMDSCPDDPINWIYNDTAATQDQLLGLGCYGSQKQFPKANTQINSQLKIPQRAPCNGAGPTEGGTIYELEDI